MIICLCLLSRILLGHIGLVRWRIKCLGCVLEGRTGTKFRVFLNASGGVGLGWISVGRILGERGVFA